MKLTIREYQARDAPGLRQCVVAMQEFERSVDPRLRPGEVIADVYSDRVHQRCREAAGMVFVADQDNAVVGFVAVLAQQPHEELDDPPGTYAVITDLSVLPSYRTRGIGQQLLARAERFARGGRNRIANRCTC